MYWNELIWNFTLPLHLRNIFTSKIGRLDEFQASILSWLISTTFIWMWGHLEAITAQLGPPTYPAPMQHMLLTFLKNPTGLLSLSPSIMFEYEKTRNKIWKSNQLSRGEENKNDLRWFASKIISNNIRF